MEKYLVVHASTEEKFVIEVEDGMVVSCDKDFGDPQGMDWVDMYTKIRFGGPLLRGLAYATAMTHMIMPVPPDNDDHKQGERRPTESGVGETEKINRRRLR